MSHPRTCPGCGASLDHRDPQVRTCSARCRQRAHRDPDAGYVVTEEDRAAIRRVLERDGCGHPGPVLSPAAVREHLAASHAEDRARRQAAEDRAATVVPRPIYTHTRQETT